MDITLRRMEENDIAGVVALEASSLAHPWNEKQIRYEYSENPCAYLLVLSKGASIVGYLDFYITFDSATIARLAVTEGERKKGLATRLINEMVSICKKNNVEFITLEVRKSNEAAQRLYEKCSFEMIVTKKGYYDDGEDALYMVRCL